MVAGFVGGLAGDVEKVALARGGMIFDGRFDHVPKHVAIVGTVQKRGVPRRFLVVRHVDMQVTIRLLTGTEQIDDFVHALLQLGIAPNGQRIGNRLQELVQVRLAPGAVQFAFHRFAGRLAQRTQLPLHVGPGMRNRLFAIDLDPRRPKTIAYLHVADGQQFQSAAGFRGSRSRD